MSLTGISLIRHGELFSVSEKNLARKDKQAEAHNNKHLIPDTQRYTIFHALFEAMKEKDSKQKDD
jgi:hypothetical protein